MVGVCVSDTWPKASVTDSGSPFFLSCFHMFSRSAQTFEAQGLWERKFSETVSEKQIAVLSKGFVPVNTLKNTMWAVKAFEAWVQSHNSCTEDEIDKGTLRCTLAVRTLLMFTTVHCRS